MHVHARERETENMRACHSKGVEGEGDSPLSREPDDDPIPTLES